jgi:hypothetical protein
MIEMDFMTDLLLAFDMTCDPFKHKLQSRSVPCHVVLEYYFTLMRPIWLWPLMWDDAWTLKSFWQVIYKADFQISYN